MKNVFLIAICMLVMFSCNNQSRGGNESVSGADSAVTDQFVKFKDNFIGELWKTYPGWATSVGYHRYDSLLVIPDEESRRKELASADRIETDLKKYDLNKLDANNKTDYKLIQNFLAGLRFNINEFKSYEWDPSGYNIGKSLFDVMDYKEITLDEKLRIISRKLTFVPGYFAVAKENIRQPTKEHARLAIDQNKGSLSFFHSVFPDSLKKSSLSPAEKEVFNSRSGAAEKALVNYIHWLQDEVMTKPDSSFRSFRIGKDLYAKKFLLEIQSGYTAAEMYQKAEERKQYLLKEMGKISKALWDKYLPGKKYPESELSGIKILIDAISIQHCKPEAFLETVEKQLPELSDFINAHHLIELDSTQPLKVRKTPDYEAGVAGAGINSPGPYGKNGTTYYNVTPLTHYTPQAAESYLREYNDYVLQILNIHEAIPGHYTQLIYSNRSPSLIKSILSNGAMVEGWACYVERMMIEQGYQASPEMSLFYYKWNLREVSNFLLDYNVHCNNWSENQVLEFLVNEAFQQREEAKGKWKRATLSQVQLTSYFTGLTEIYELREDIKKKKGEDFDLKKFHEQFLSYGSAPVKEIRALMLP